MKLWNVSFFNKQENKPNLLVNPHDNKNVETGETSQGSFIVSHVKEWVRFCIEKIMLESLDQAYYPGYIEKYGKEGQKEF